MPTCSKCGKEISQATYESYNTMCSECVFGFEEKETVCVKCGTPISQSQYENFNKMCPTCIQLGGLSTRHSGKSLMCVGGFILLIGLSTTFVLGFFAGAQDPTAASIGFTVGPIILIVALILIYLGYQKTKS